MNYILDTDPGVDDALAILFAVLSGMNIQGITTVFGNASVHETTRNVFTILELLQKNIPVYKGSAKPLQGKAIRATSHGQNGLGGYITASNSHVEDLPAKDYFNTLSEKKKNSVLMLGPATNLAQSFTAYPQLVNKIDSIIMLGGVIGEQGNITSKAEFNVYNDPYAFQYVLERPCKKTLIPINVCRKVTFTLEDFTRLTDPIMGQTILEITKLYIQYYMNDTVYGGFKGGVMYDLLVVGYALMPELFSKKELCIHVDTTSKKSYRETKINPYESSNCVLVTDVQAEKLKTLFFSIMNRKKSRYNTER